MGRCLVCEKHETASKYELYRNEQFVIEHYVPKPDTDDNYLGYYLVESVRHFDGIENATEKETNQIFNVIRGLSKAMMDYFQGQRVYLFVIGDHVSHFHAHVVIKYKTAPNEYSACKVDEWPEAPRGTSDKIISINNDILKIMQDKFDAESATGIISAY